MKSAIAGCTCAVIMICTVLLVAGISTGSCAKQRAVNTANECAYSSIASLYDSPDGYGNNGELVGAFMESATAYMKSQNQDCDVKIYGADCEKGMIDVEIICPYRDVFQTERKVSVRRTVIIDSVRSD